jgi:hypothetical protein
LLLLLLLLLLLPLLLLLLLLPLSLHCSTNMQVDACVDNVTLFPLCLPS